MRRRHQQREARRAKGSAVTITDDQIRELLAFSRAGRRTDRKLALGDNCIAALEGSLPHRQQCMQEHLRLNRLRAVIRDFFKDKPPGTTIEQHELDAYHRRLREAALPDKEGS